mmetsp:Transcript_16149/g.45239  ORF Transcript_16149/g.45239 Transcript_16149/m.45239 type:complete len:245 (-) Transcript_16149:154-888(-)
MTMAATLTAPLKILGPASFRTFRCLWMLEELGIEYEHLPLLPLSKEVKKYNPLRKVPVLITHPDGFVLYESAAINTYLCDLVQHPTMVPPPRTESRAIYDQTVSVIISELDAQGLWIQRKHEGMGDLFTFVPDAVTHARKYFHKTNRALIGQLKQPGPYLLGPDFTAADVLYVHCLDWSKTIGWDEKWKDDAAVVRYMTLCKQRPAFRKVAAMRAQEIEASVTKRRQRKGGKASENGNNPHSKL